MRQHITGGTMVDVVAPLMALLSESSCSSGSYVSPANRLMLMGLAMSLHARDILETGTSTGGTALAFALTGARVVTIDHDQQHPEVRAIAQHRLCGYQNVSCVHDDALFYMATQPSSSVDMMFLDDGHWPEYTRKMLAHAQRVLRPGGIIAFHDTLSCHMWEVIESTFPATWQRMNVPSWQGDTGYTGTPNVDGQDFGLGWVRKSYSISDKMALYESSTPTILYDIHARVTDGDGQYEDVGREGVDALVDYYLTLLEAWRLRPDLVDASTVDEAHRVCYGYGLYCAQRADEAMRRKYTNTG